MAKIRVGTSGWSYKSWHGPFYPQGCGVAQELRFASRAFDSLEANRSFYSLLTPHACQTWYEQTPSDFIIAVKGSRFISHNKKLLDAEGALANFFASGVLALEDKLGPIVWQLPHTFRYDEARLAAFFELLPKSMQEAGSLAKHHDHRVKHGSYTEVRSKARIRYVIEARHESFRAPAFARLSRQFGIAIAVSDSPQWPRIEEVTTNFMYLRLHGSQKLYASEYTDAELEQWAQRILCWQQGQQPARAMRISSLALPRHKGRDVYVYFDNDAHAHAPADAQRLVQRLAQAQAKAQAHTGAQRVRCGARLGHV